MARPSIGMVAGEPSGDLLAASVVEALHARAPQFALTGIGGPKMQAHGFEAWYPMQKLAVNGYADVLMHLPELLQIRRAVRERWLAERPAAFVGVDAPDFNFSLEHALRAGGIPTVHFIGPSLWAWRGERINKIREAVSRILVVFPFEEQIYRDAGVPVTYVGHPLARTIAHTPDRAAARARLGAASGARVLALMPGSRAGEVRHLAPRFLAAAKLLQIRDPALELWAPMANAEREREFLAHASAVGGLKNLHTIVGGSHDILAACDAVLVASGTATLEAALFKRPMVISYVLPRLSWWIMRRQAYLPWVGLPNILCRDTLVPELLQDDATPRALADAAWKALTDEAGARRLEARFGALHDDLVRDTPALASQAILEVAGHG
ncbi:MAG: lipid-A-disaccharide synthase [Pigmentiphaga sp.]|uniref:lipid-A-disaccharide synthase n=1 Tax=Pigmentiphaga sp. TaxID=1977564 RepID=UPI0029BE71BB|nr:lipid-A-disaccharide synthase [Pigmentiphaga sp.]MDX3905631.1 lipid-A-disaccharide synthase [Pigmentiphaga sp.]